ncbi:hypothetical protein F4781DRAFT_428949 [Annulohypoxylon bovei var. microspora]|nr:hypothetical protein F4781DRAFT_428949 [Annulohypoxylon bovei var. microspora]
MAFNTLFNVTYESNPVTRASFRQEDVPKEVSFRALYKHEFLKRNQQLFNGDDFILCHHEDTESLNNATKPRFWGRIATSATYPFRELRLIWKDLRLLMAARREVRRANDQLIRNRQDREYYICRFSDTEDPDKLLMTFEEINPSSKRQKQQLEQQVPDAVDLQEPDLRERRKLVGHMT